jgi:anaerobic selenocysteine-containing dehydrogenase
MNHPEPWFPFAAGDFPTPSGRCELHAESLIEEGMDPLPRHDPPTGEPTPVAPVYPLTFMSPKSQRYFLNSSHANQPRHLRAAGEPRIWIHPDDAARRGIVSGDTVRAYNARGSVELAAEVTDGTRPGLVAMAHGW